MTTITNPRSKSTERMREERTVEIKGLVATGIADAAELMSSHL
jgi:hypothetical protein